MSDHFSLKTVWTRTLTNKAKKTCHSKIYLRKCKQPDTNIGLTLIEH